MDAYKEISSCVFPTWPEVLHVLNSLGYRKIEPAKRNPAHSPVPQGERSSNPIPAAGGSGAAG
jgi:hypothetical protein